MTVKLTIPDLGDFSDVEVIEVIAAPGDVVAVEDPLITLETDKATMDVPAEQAGTIVSVDVSGLEPVTVEVGSTYSDDGATAVDNYDGDITADIVTVNPVDTSTPGTYVVTYDVTDSSGNGATQVTRTVHG